LGLIEERHRMANDIFPQTTPATAAEVTEAIRVAAEMRARGAYAHSALALDTQGGDRTADRSRALLAGWILPYVLEQLLASPDGPPSQA